MSYNPTNWMSGDIITSQKLNKIEQGIANIANADIADCIIMAQMNGAIGDGITDDTAALQTIFNRSNAIIEGGNKPYKLLELVLENQQNLVIQNFRFYHGIKITLKHCENITFHNCIWDEFQDNGIENKNVYGIVLTTNHTGSDEWVEANNWRYDEVCRNITFDNCQFIGTHYTENTPSLFVNNKPHYNTGICIRLEGVDGLYVQHCYFTQNRGNACIHQNCYAPIGDFVLKDNLFYLNAWGGISLYRSTGFGSYPTRLIQGNRFIGHGLGYLPWEYLELFPGKERGVGTAAVYCGSMSRVQNLPFHCAVVDNYFEDNNESSIEGWQWNPIKNNIIIGNGVLQSAESVTDLTAKYNIPYQLYVRLNPSQDPIYMDQRTNPPIYPNGGYPAGELRVIENNTVARSYGTRNPIMIRGAYYEPVVIRNNTFTEEDLFTDENAKYVHFLKAYFHNGLIWENNIGMKPYFNECDFIAGDFLLDELQDIYNCTFTTQAFESLSKIDRFQQLKSARFSPEYATLRDNTVSNIVDGKPVLGCLRFSSDVIIPEPDWDIAEEADYVQNIGYTFDGSTSSKVLNTGMALGQTDSSWTIFVDTTTTGNNDAADHSYLIKLLTFCDDSGTLSLELGSRYKDEAWTWLFPNAVWSYDNMYCVDQNNTSNSFLAVGSSTRFILRYKAGTNKIEVFAKRSTATPLQFSDIACGEYNFTPGTTGTLRFGGAVNSNRPLSYYAGVIKDARVFESALTDQQVSKLIIGYDINANVDPTPIYDIANDSRYVTGTGLTFDGTFGIDTNIPILEDTNDFTIVATFKFDDMASTGKKPNFSYYPVFSAMNTEMPSQAHGGYTDKGISVGLSLQNGMDLNNTAGGGFITFRRDWRYTNSIMIDSVNYYSYYNHFYTVVLVRENGILKVLDNNLVETMALRGEYATSIIQGNLTLGARMGYDSNFTNFFKGVISEFKVYDSAINLSFIEQTHPSIEDNLLSEKGAITYHLCNKTNKRLSVRDAFIELNYDLGEFNSPEYTVQYPKAFGIRMDEIFDDVLWVPCSSSKRIVFHKRCKWTAIYDPYENWNIDIINPGTIPTMNLIINGIKVILLSKQEAIPDTVDATDFMITWEDSLEEMAIGDSIAGYTQFVPEEATTGTALTATSDDESIATVAISGQNVTVTAVAEGETLIHVSIPYGTEHIYNVTVISTT